MSNFNIDAKPVAAGYVLAQGANGRFKPVDPGTLTPASHLTPAANNTYDLGITGTRWRTVYAGTSLDTPKITYAGDGEIDLSGAATRTLTVRNSTVAQVANLDLDGTYYFRNGTAFTVRLSGTPTANRVFTFPDVADDTVALLGAAQTFSGAKTFTEAPRVTEIADANGATALALPATVGAVNRVSIGNAATLNAVFIGVVGDDANIALDVAPKGTGAATLRAGNGSARIAIDNTGIGLNGATPVAQGAHIPDAAGGATVDAEARAALNTLLAHLRLRGDLAAS